MKMSLKKRAHFTIPEEPSTRARTERLSTNVASHSVCRIMSSGLDCTSTCSTTTTSTSTVAQPEPIHSGQFMRTFKSKQEEDEDSDSDVDVDVCSDDTSPSDKPVAVSAKIFIVSENEKPKPVTFYKFGPKRSKSIAIDVSLGQLKRCITTAYSKLTTPKWKDFKGLRLDWKQRIRLNNVIWRAWPIEFGFNRHARKKAPYVYFSVPGEELIINEKLNNTQTTALMPTPPSQLSPRVRTNWVGAGVIEGMYWKRRFEAVCAQYRRWRHFYAHRMKVKFNKSKFSEHSCPYLNDCKHNEGCWVPQPPNPPRCTSVSSQHGLQLEDDDFNNPFTDRLFDSLSQPYMFPDRKDLACQGASADFIQPALQPLQPSLEEIMASLDSPYNFGEPESNSESYGIEVVIPNQRANTTRPNTNPDSSAPIDEPLPADHSAASSLSYTSRDYQAANMLIQYSQMPLTQAEMSASVVSTARGPSVYNTMRSTGLSYESGFVPAMHMLPPPLPVNMSAYNPGCSAGVMSSSAPNLHLLTSGPSTQFPASYEGGWLSPPSHLYAPGPSIPANGPAPVMSKGARKAPHTSAVIESPNVQTSNPRSTKRPSADSASSKRGGVRAKRGRRGSVASVVSSTSSSTPVSPPQYLLLSPHVIVGSKSQYTKSAQLTPQSTQANELHSRLLPIGAAKKVPEVSGPPMKHDQPLRRTPQMILPNAPLTSAMLTSSSTLVTPVSMYGASQVTYNHTGIGTGTGIGIGTGNVKTESSSNQGATSTRTKRIATPTRRVAADSSSTDGGSSYSGANRVGTIDGLSPDQDEDQRSEHSQSPVTDKKRLQHLHAEQSRRCALKDGFAQLMSLVPNLNEAGTKLTNAVVLSKGADHVRRLHEEEKQREAELTEMKLQLQNFHQKIALGFF